MIEREKDRERERERERERGYCGIMVTEERWKLRFKELATNLSVTHSLPIPLCHKHTHSLSLFQSLQEDHST